MQFDDFGLTGIEFSQFFQCCVQRQEVGAERTCKPFVWLDGLTMTFGTSVVLARMVESLPDTLDKFSRLDGVGQSKLDNYGEEFVGLIRQYLKQHEPDLSASEMGGMS